LHLPEFVAKVLIGIKLLMQRIGSRNDDKGTAPKAQDY
jgi:hypothetical protein